MDGFLAKVQAAQPSLASVPFSDQTALNLSIPISDRSGVTSREALLRVGAAILAEAAMRVGSWEATARGGNQPFGKSSLGAFVLVPDSLLPHRRCDA